MLSRMGPQAHMSVLGCSVCMSEGQGIGAVDNWFCSSATGSMQADSVGNGNAVRGAQ